MDDKPLIPFRTAPSRRTRCTHAPPLVFSTRPLDGMVANMELKFIKDRQEPESMPRKLKASIRVKS